MKKTRKVSISFVLQYYKELTRLFCGTCTGICIDKV